MLVVVLLLFIMIEIECLEDFWVMVIMLILVWVSVVKNFVEILCKVCILLFIIEIMVSCFVIVSGFSKFFFSFR